MIDLPVSDKRSAALDFLRSALAVWVLFAHLVPFVELAQGSEAVNSPLSHLMRTLTLVFQPSGETHPAVLAFIVLSGYCIHRNGLRGGRWNLTSYFTRRTFRIYPIYLTATLVGVLAFGASVKLDQNLTQLLSGTTSITFECLATKLSGLAAVIPSLNICAFEGNAPLRTVAAELWLYAVYPFALLAILFFGEFRFWSILTVVFILGTLLIVFKPQYAGWWHNDSLPGFLMYWWIGAKSVDPVFSRLLRRSWPVLFVAWLLFGVLIVKQWPGSALFVEPRKLLFALQLSCLISLIGASVAASGAFEVIGRAGYSIYAFHAPLVYLMAIAFVPWWITTVIVVIAGTFMFVIIERPLDRLGRKLASYSVGLGVIRIPKSGNL